MQSGRRQRAVLSISAALFLGILSCATAAADLQTIYRLNIPAQDLSKALRMFARVSRQQVVFDSTLTAGKRSAAVVGNYAAEQALVKMLAGTGLIARRGATGVLVVQSMPAVASGNDAPEEESSPIIVTGTRERAKRAIDSVSPVDLASPEAIHRTGQTNLSDALVRLSPSITKPVFGHATGNLTNFISLRGLNPSQTLILLNGKRRHGSALMNTTGSMDGSTPTDIDLIPGGLVERVEILRDGAGAQYGSDAIAGVVNIILKSADRGGSYKAEFGQFYAGDGRTASLDAQQAFPLGRDGYLSISGAYRRHEHTDRNDIDTRTNAYTTKLFGDPSSHQYTAGFTAGYRFDEGTELYTAGTYAHRTIDMLQLYRLPSVLPQIYPNGFSPISGAVENDFSATLGLRGDDLAGWSWDLGTTLGINDIKRVLKDSANLNLFAATGSTPTDMDVGAYTFTQWTSTLDLNRALRPAFLPFPLNVALGAEFRRETYEVRAGEPASYELGGGQSVGGIAPASAGRHARNVYSGYVDLATRLNPAWQFGAAGRYEHYSDFGDTLSGKLSMRYDIARGFALRGTISNGKRAPSLANEYYSQIGNTPTTLSGVLGANSAAARVLGAKPLKPERATNITLGAVMTPIERLNLTVDVYRIDIAGRIANSPTYRGLLAIQAFALAGLDVDPTIAVNNVSARFYSNAVDTRSLGVDMSVDYRTPLGDLGTIDWKLAFNYNDVEITHVNDDLYGAPMINDQTRSYITTASPKDRLTASALWKRGPWKALIEGQRFGRTLTGLTYRTGPNANSSTLFEMFVNEPRYLANIDISYQANALLSLALGVNNLFDVHPSTIPMSVRYYGTERYNGYASQIGINGGYYYARALVNF